MPYKLTVDMENLAPDAEVVIAGLGTFQNGQSYEISDEDEQAFRDANQTDVGGVIDDPEHESFGAYVPKYEPGPALVDANMYGVTVEEVKQKASKSTSSGPVAPPDQGSASDTGGAS